MRLFKLLNLIGQQETVMIMQDGDFAPDAEDIEREALYYGKVEDYDPLDCAEYMDLNLREITNIYARADKADCGEIVIEVK